MTSNLASDITMRLAAAGERAPTSDDLAKALRPALTRHFKPALLARMTVVPFFPITAEVLRQIVELKLGLVAARMHESHRVSLGFSTAVYDAIVARCEEADTGARNVDHIVREHLLPILASQILAHLAQGDLPDAMTVDLDASGAFTVVAPAAEVLAAAS